MIDSMSVHKSMVVLVVFVCTLLPARHIDAQTAEVKSVALQGYPISFDFDPETGGVVTVEDTTINFYKREYFQDPANTPVVTRDFETKQIGKVFFSGFGEKTRIVITVEDKIHLLNPADLSEDRSVSFSDEKMIPAYPIPTGRNSPFLLCRASRNERQLTLLNLESMKFGDDLTTPFRMERPPELSHDGNVCYTNTFAFAFARGSLEHLGGSFSGDSPGVLPDKVGRLVSTGYEVRTADCRDHVGEFDFFVTDFAEELPVVAGIEWRYDMVLPNVCLGSLTDFKTLSRVDVPEEILQRPSTRRRRKGKMELVHRSSKNSGPGIRAFVDERAKRLLLLGTQTVGVVSFEDVDVPKARTEFARIAKFESVPIGETLERKIDLPVGGSVNLDGLPNGKFENGLLTWTPRPSQVSNVQVCEVRSADGKVLERIPLSATLDSLKVNVEVQPANPREKRPAYKLMPTHFEVAHGLIAVWSKSDVALLNAKSGEIVWQTDSDFRFGSDVGWVLVGEKQVVVATRNDSFVMSRERDFRQTKLGQVRNFLTGSDGSMYYRDRRNELISCETLEPIEGGGAFKKTKTGFVKDGVFYDKPNGKPLLLVSPPLERNLRLVAPDEINQVQLLVANSSEAMQHYRPRNWKRERKVFSEQTGFAFSGSEKQPLMIAYQKVKHGWAFMEQLRLNSGSSGVTDAVIRDNVLFCLVQDRIYQVPLSVFGTLSALKSTHSVSPLDIVRRQSIFAVSKSGSKLEYRISGGKGPYKLTAQCGSEATELESADGVFEWSIDGKTAELAANGYMSSKAMLDQVDEVQLKFRQRDRNLKQGLSQAISAYASAVKPVFTEVVGRKPRGVAVPVGVKLTFSDSDGNSRSFGHYLFYEVTPANFLKQIMPARK